MEKVCLRNIVRYSFIIGYPLDECVFEDESSCFEYGWGKRARDKSLTLTPSFAQDAVLVVVVVVVVSSLITVTNYNKRLLPVSQL